ncbi:hypothetical protein [Sporosarcina sp. D27]|uniref:hypothetical protein n=1 Tax=Sporosarcina sp. D27 TaxID=1382305 RepID=UPI00046FFE7B|nr:hypothetical protein [Sporosarcina sp. D27]
MMILVPFLVAVISGSIVLLITWGLIKKNFSLPIRNIPGIVTVIAANVLFYIGFVMVRGFEGVAYLFLAFFLVGFAVVSFLMAIVMEKKLVGTK